MIKINLNELRRNKIFTFYEDYYDSTGFFPSYYCGFIDNIFIENGFILLNVYGYGLQRKLKYDKFKIDIKNINKFETNDEISEIKTCTEYNDYDYETDEIIGKVQISNEFKFFKNNDFRFIMREFYKIIPSSFICELESKMLTDKKVLNIVDIPYDYEFGEY